MNTGNASTPEAQVRGLLESWTKAVQARDMDSVLACHSRDVVMFDVPPPAYRRGMREYRQAWEMFYRCFPRQGGIFEIADLDIAASDELAYGYGLLRCGSRDHSFAVRLTVCMRRIHGEWAIVHEHHSVPATDATD